MSFPKRVEISKIKKLSTPSKFVFFDCETKPRNMKDGYILHNLWFGCALYWKPSKGKETETLEDITFTDQETLWDFITSRIGPGETLYLFAHNIKFDFLVARGFQQLPDYGYTLKGLYHKFTTTIMRFTNNNRRLIIADTMNYFPVSLDKLAKTVGEKKVQVDFDNPDLGELKRRCKSDVLIIYKAVRMLIEKLIEENLGGFKPTSPSISFNIFRYRFMKYPIITHHNDEMVNLEKQSYYGGYVNVFKLFGAGKPDLYKLDINAMYPSVMRLNKYPVQMVDYLRNVDINRVRSLLKDRLMTVRCTINTPEPVFPFRYPGGVCYPLGTFETVLPTPSLRYAMQKGYVKQIYELVLYQGREIFKEYVDFMYLKRQQAKLNKDTASELFYKTMMNSLYGKFGQTSTTSTVVGECDPSEFSSYTAFDARTGESWKEIHAGGSVMFIQDGDESRYTFYAVAAHVTDYARRKLFELISLAGWDNVYYSDTDSILVNDRGLVRVEKYLHNDRLGYLKMEDKGPIFLGFAKKDYLLGNERKIKGFSKEPIPGHKHLFKAVQSVSFYGAMKRSINKGAYWKQLEKLHRPYLKDCQVDDHGNVTPLVMPEMLDLLGKRIETIEMIRTVSRANLSPIMSRVLDHWI